MEEEIIIPGPFFKFPDELTGMEQLRLAGFINEDGEYITSSHNHALDVIGIIKRGGELDEDGNQISQLETLDGWHVNYQGKLPDGWEQYAVYPKTPVRYWF